MKIRAQFQNKCKTKVPLSLIQKGAELLFSKLQRVQSKDFELQIHPDRQYGYTIVCVGERQIARLNGLYRNRNVPTDVLSFCPPEEMSAGGISNPIDLRSVYLGEIVLCPVKIRENAMRFGEKYEIECTRIVIHGLLHLVGYDHIGALGEKNEPIFVLQEEVISDLMRVVKSNKK